MIPKIPWLALLLLLATNMTLGGFLSAWHGHWLGWVVVALCILVLGAMLSCSWATMRDSFAHLLASDLRAFIVAVLVALLGVAIIFWLHTLAHFLVIMCAFLLAKIDLQTANFSDRQIFGTITFISLSGLFLGGLINYLVSTLILE
ncbi:MAG: hypothetical protein KME01_05735 [Chroococcus sp. CMT-3BRIN-NPC107]|jgi:hypothetical protein|nr:hypothetical protein [Chroococcus sp. CMT-3BRIN-NPC107]